MVILTLPRTILLLGLLLGILATIFLAKGLIKADMEIIQESSSFYSRNYAIRRSLIQQKQDAIIGLIFLFSAFLFQWLGTFIDKDVFVVHLSIRELLLISIAILLFLFLTYQAISGYSKNRAESEYFRVNLVDHKRNPEKCLKGWPTDESIITGGENVFNLPKKDNESIADYRSRLLKHILDN